MIRFKPLPGLTIVTLICVAILLTLGTWQYKRLHWKRALLVQIDQAANASPVQSLAELADIMAADEPLDFRRIALKGRFTASQNNDGAPFMFMRSNGKALQWRPYQVYEQGDFAIFVQAPPVTEAQKAGMNFMPEAAAINGYVRRPERPNFFTPKSNAKTNSWFAFNPAPDTLDWYGASSTPILHDVYIDWQQSAVDADDLPVKIPDIRNNHLDYMLTWYSFVLILLIIYFILHKRQGRLTFGARDA